MLKKYFENSLRARSSCRITLGKVCQIVSLLVHSLLTWLSSGPEKWYVGDDLNLGRLDFIARADETTEAKIIHR